MRTLGASAFPYFPVRESRRHIRLRRRQHVGCLHAEHVGDGLRAHRVARPTGFEPADRHAGHSRNFGELRDGVAAVQTLNAEVEALGGLI